MFGTLDSKPGSTNGRTFNGYQAALISDSPLTTRGIAWILRTVAQAAALSPTSLDNGNTLSTSDQLQQAFAKSIDDTANFTYGTFITGTLNGGGWKNNLGWIKFSYDDNYAGEGVNKPDGSPTNMGTIPVNGQFWGAGWMFGFQNMVLCHAVELSIENLSAPLTLAAVRNFNLRHATQNMQRDNTYWNYRRGGVFNRPYTANYSSTPPTFLTQQSAFSSYLSVAVLNATLDPSVGGTLMQHDTDAAFVAPDSSDSASGFWALHISGLQMGAETGVVQAAESIELLSQSPNYAANVTEASNSPQFAIVSRLASAKPAWWNSI